MYLAPHLWDIHYNGAIFPGSDHQGLQAGANCQVFAYAVLATHGFHLPPFRSSDLWLDRTHTHITHTLEPLDLLLFHHEPSAYGAHVALYWGEQQVLHLAQHHGRPRLESVASISAHPRYRCFIGAKRVVKPSPAIP